MKKEEQELKNNLRKTPEEVLDFETNLQKRMVWFERRMKNISHGQEDLPEQDILL